MTRLSRTSDVCCSSDGKTTNKKETVTELAMYLAVPFLTRPATACLVFDVCNIRLCRSNLVDYIGPYLISYIGP